MKSYYSEKKELQKRANFELRFAELKQFLIEFNRFPTIQEKSHLYNWLAALKGDYKRNRLDFDFFEKLKSIGFQFDKKFINSETYYSSIKEQQSENTFNKNFLLLEFFVENNRRLPSQSEDETLYTWIANLTSKHKRNRLEKKYVDRLNSLGIIWQRTDANWFEKANLVLKIIQDEKRLPNQKSENTLYRWLKSELHFLNDILYNKEKLIVLRNIQTALNKLQNKHTLDNKTLVFDSKEIKWNIKFIQLQKFREENKNKWPQFDSKDKKINKLAIWCQSLRSLYKKGLLSESWIARLKSIAFNFQGQTDNWKNRFQLLEKFIAQNNSLPPTSDKLYNWSRLQYKSYNNLSLEKVQLLESLNFLKYAEKDGLWIEKFEELKLYVSEYQKSPTRNTYPNLYLWLRFQRAKYKQNELDETQIKLLKSINIDLAPLEKREVIWENKFEELKKFREDNPNRWPSYHSVGKEKKLYEWCQAQRQTAAGTALNRKGLSENRIMKLKSIGFIWTLEEFNQKNWDEFYSEIEKQFKESNGTFKISSKSGKNYNKYYTWLINQKKKIKANKLSEEKIQKLMKLNLV